MSEIYDGGPVFPDYQRGEALPLGTTTVKPVGGISLRDYFAGQALAGLIAAYNEVQEEYISKRAYVYADAMLAARSKP